MWCNWSPLWFLSGHHLPHISSWCNVMMFYDSNLLPFFGKKIPISLLQTNPRFSVPLGFHRAKSCVARCRQLCARSSCEHAARAASVWVKPKSFHIPVPLNLDSLDYVIDFSDFSRGPPISGTSETEKWDPYKIRILKLGFPGISPFFECIIGWLFFMIRLHLGPFGPQSVRKIRGIRGQGAYSSQAAKK